jgi:hypothetical protein
VRSTILRAVGRSSVIYLKSVLVGIVAALVASVLYILAAFVLPLLLPFLLSRIAGTGGTAAATVSEGPVLGIALMAFVVGSYWEFRRVSKIRSHVR